MKTARGVRSFFSLLALAALAAGLRATPPPAGAPAAGRFALRVAGNESELELLSHFLLPGAAAEVTVVGGVPPFTARAEGGVLAPRAAGRYAFQPAPGAGRVLVEIADGAGRVLRRRFFVLVPYDGAAQVGGFRIGDYPAEPFKNLAAYARPSGLLPVRHEDLELAVSPHFRLGQFLCKQDGGAPAAGGVAYVVLRTELLEALEQLLAGVRAAGIPAGTLAILSGFRTPHYNRMIGNDTIYSRHTYGDAADVYVDRDGDGRMDDLDGDGRSDAGDARLLFTIAERLAGHEIAAGGLGIYSPKPHRGPFLHLDTRGYAARWES